MSAGSEHRSPESIAENLSKPRANLILEFSENEDEALNTSDLRGAVDGGRDSVRYHMMRSNVSLNDQGLIRCVGYDEDADTPGDNDPYLYELTPRGREVLEVYRQRAIEKAVDISKFDELRDEVEDLRAEVEQAEKERERLREALREERERVDERFEKMKKFLKSHGFE